MEKETKKDLEELLKKLKKAEKEYQEKIEKYGLDKPEVVNNNNTNK